MDSDAEEVFDRLTRMAARLIGAPVAIMSLVDDHRQYFKSGVGLDLDQTPLTHSLCKRVVSDGSPLIVTDARDDPRTIDDPAVSELGLIAYAGVPLTASDGNALGAFCAVDHHPRQWTQGEIEVLTDLAASAMTEIELRIANRELAAREAETRSIIEGSHEAFFTCDTDGTVLAYNPAAERLFGWTEAEVVGRPVTETLVPEDLREQAAADFRRHDRALDGLRNELRAVHRSGREITIEASFAIADQSGGRRFHVIARDVGELRALERRRAHLASIVESAEEAITTVDRDGAITSWNAGAERIYGFTAEEMIGGPPLPSEQLDGGGTGQRVRRALAGESETLHNVARRHKSGELVYVDLSFAPLRDERGTVTGATAIARDVTERHRLERELESSERRFRATAVALEEGRRLLDDSQAIGGVGSWSYNLDTRETTWSAEQFRLYGLEPAASAPGLTRMLELVHPDDREPVRSTLTRLMDRPRGFTGEFRVCPRAGETRILWVRADLLPADPATGRGARVTGTTLDVTSQRETELRRRALEERHRELLSSLPDTMVTLYDRDLRCTLLQGALIPELGLDVERFEGRHLSEFVNAQQYSELEPLVYRALEGESITFDYPGGDRVFEVTMAPYRGEPDTITGAFTVWRDITARIREQEARHEVEERLRVTVEHAPIGVALIDLQSGAHGRLLSVNDAFATLLADPDPVAGELSLASFVHPDDTERLRADLTLLSTDGLARTETEVRCLRTDGTVVWLLLTGAAVPTAHDAPQLAVVHALDIGERKRFEGQLQHLADHDALTGLFNRRRFEAELARAVSLADRYDHSTALLMIDLDGFKHVNDTMGHSYGDELVTRIGATLRSTLRDTDVIARLGGDEFAVILTSSDTHEATVVAEKVLYAIEHHGVVISEERHASVTASVGVTVFDQGTGLDAEELMIEADVAMYQAKDGGRNRLALFEREPGSSQKVTARQSWLVRLRAALDQEKFELYAQPIRGIQADEIERYELLLRLHGEDGELLTPGTFLYNAERFDLIQEIDRWVFEQAAIMLGECAAAGRDVSLSVNMSGKTLSDPHLISDLTAIIARHPIIRERLIVEVTETAAIVNIDKARDVARALRGLGCRFALDDFGAGFASFYYLKHLEFDYVKIDGEFVKSLSVNATDQLVIKSVVDIARGLGAETIAEFVQDGDSMRRLGELGVDYGQGYHLGRPKPVSQVLPVARRRAER
jgi:diguanylate cyclase (GGDEF)-like protein/PAS domain S-box-containing protein